jgi:hypothetical protein
LAIASTEPLLPAEEEEGITVAERREIIASIDKVASRNRISSASGRSNIVPLKKGFLFPLVVNLFVIVVTAATLVVLAFAFRQRDQSITEGNVIVTTAEGKLIQEIKRESDSLLQEKEKAIAEIQGRIGSIEKQRNDLAASFEQRVSLRETELRAALKVELDKERKRLEAQGLSESVIQERLKKFEAQKTAEFALQLASFKKQTEASKAAEDARLAQARDEYQRNISGLNDDRKKILSDAKAREDQLQSALDAKTKELEGQSAAAKAGLAKAQSDLSRLEDQRSKAQAAEDRILGLYGSVRNALRERRFSDALASVSALSSYLNDPSVLSVPSIQARREADLFVADALGNLARGELEKTSVDTSKLLAQAELVAAARSASAAGDKALKSGDPATAAAKYQESLATVPEILAAHDYFTAKAKEEDAARKLQFDAALLEAQKAWRAGTDASAKAGIAADSKAARDAFAAGNRSLAAGKWPDAIASYIGLVGAYPLAQQIPDALKGIAAARAGMDKDSEARASAYEKTIADLQAKVGLSSSDLQGQSRELSAALAALKDAKDGQAAAKDGQSAAEKRLADVEQKLKGSQDEVARLQKQLADVQAATAQASVQAATVKPIDAAAAAAAAGDAKALAELRAQVAALKKEYSGYVDAEKAASAKTGSGAAIDRQKRLIGFLGGAEFKALFPELGGMVDTQITSYRQEISLETLRIAADIAIQATKAKTALERQATLDSNAKHYADDPTIKSFIDQLSDLLK